MSDDLDFTEGCRTCLYIGAEEEMYSIFNEDENQVSIATVIFLITGIQVDDDLDLPTRICKTCLSEVLTAKQFREKCIENDVYVRQVYSRKKNDVEESFQQERLESLPPELELKPEPEPEPEPEVEIENEPANEMRIEENDGNFNEVYTEFFEMDDLETLDAIEYIEEKQLLPEDQDQKEYIVTALVESPKFHPQLENYQKPKKTSTNNGDHCSICNKYFANTRSLKLHEASHFIETSVSSSSSSQAFECDICGRNFQKKCYLNTHMHNMHVIDKKYSCEYCDKKYHNKWNFDNHTRTHTNSKPFQCEICSKTFYAQHKLKIHLRIHFNEKRYKCEYCDRAFNYYTDRKRHTMMVHTGERPYVCICGKGFVKRNSLKSHEKTHLKKLGLVGED